MHKLPNIWYEFITCEFPIYYDFAGILDVVMSVSVHSSQPLEFTLTCISYGGPATDVLWTRDSVEIEGGVTVLGSARSSRYRHTLNDTEEGVYNCTVSNNKPTLDSAEQNITGTCTCMYMYDTCMHESQ